MKLLTEHITKNIRRKIKCPINDWAAIKFKEYIGYIDEYEGLWWPHIPEEIIALERIYMPWYIICSEVCRGKGTVWAPE